MKVNEKIDSFRQLMQKKNMDAYVIVSDDFHASEYVGEYFRARAYMSGFTGSAGTLVILQDCAALWTDGRYFLQAEEQLDGSGIQLMKIGQKDVLSIPDFLNEKLSANAVVGFDGRTVSQHFVNQLQCKLADKNISFVYHEDLVDAVWQDRPSVSKNPVWELDIKYTGLSRADKLRQVRQSMVENASDVLILTVLDEIAWLLNLRGSDVQCTPVFLSYMIVKEHSAELFIHREAVSDNIAVSLEQDGIELKSYDDFYIALAELPDDINVQLDSRSANYFCLKSLPDAVNITDAESPIAGMKAVKTSTEIENIRQAHIYDGIAVTKFIYWLKTNVKTANLTELDACKRLEAFRRENPSYIGTSFDSILAYGAHGAIVHYEPDEKSNARMQPNEFCLADVGGHYYEGTTDVTRTIALGALTEEEKRAYTLVLKGHLNLSDAKFRYGVCGENLDYLARSPLWEYGLDYNHGTGHGVGYLLCVHEGPQSFNWNINRSGNHYVLEEGMVISNEPGLYIENKFGIRLENLITVKKAEKNAYAQFMQFENLTVVPFDIDAIDVSLLDDKQKTILNRYHRMVYDTLSPYFNGSALEWLKQSTRSI